MAFDRILTVAGRGDEVLPVAAEPNVGWRIWHNQWIGRSGIPPGTDPVPSGMSLGLFAAPDTIDWTDRRPPFGDDALDAITQFLANPVAFETPARPPNDDSVIVLPRDRVYTSTAIPTSEAPDVPAYLGEVVSARYVGAITVNSQTDQALISFGVPHLVMEMDRTSPPIAFGYNVVVERPGIGTGGTRQIWAELRESRADAEVVISDAPAPEAGQRIQHEFRVRWDPELSIFDRVMYAGDEYDVTDVAEDTTGGRRRQYQTIEIQRTAERYEED